MGGVITIVTCTTSAGGTREKVGRVKRVQKHKQLDKLGYLNHSYTNTNGKKTGSINYLSSRVKSFIKYNFQSCNFTKLSLSSFF